MQTFKTFIEESRFGDDSIIDWAFFNVYPELKMYIKKDSNGKYYVTDMNAIEEFVTDEYTKNNELMKKNIQDREDAWKKKKNIYFSFVDELFEERYWPKGKYIAYATIWGIYPKFLEDKTFQIPVLRLDNKYAVSVITHEMLHFIFYEYFISNYPKYNMDDNSFFIWNVSEAFNEIIQNHPKWIKEFEFGCDIYGGRDKLVKELQNKYYKSDIINPKTLISDIIDKLKNDKNILLND
ncbi:MAG: hypothetical protein PHR47_00940 [Candidatus Pacebacteria bacterium]|nr:hypothetical protein [Candidatus Paceibacterota bacterium]